MEKDNSNISKKKKSARVWIEVAVVLLCIGLAVAVLSEKTAAQSAEQCGLFVDSVAFFGGGSKAANVQRDAVWTVGTNCTQECWILGQQEVALSLDMRKCPIRARKTVSMHQMPHIRDILHIRISQKGRQLHTMMIAVLILADLIHAACRLGTGIQMRIVPRYEPMAKNLRCLMYLISTTHGAILKYYQKWKISQ